MTVQGTRDSEAAHALREVVRRGMLGAHRHLALTRGNAVCYQPGVGPFLGLPAGADATDWADAQALHDSGTFMLPGDDEQAHRPPSDRWELHATHRFTQLVHPGGLGQADDALVRLGEDDISEMAELVERTRPGPFGPRTIETGRYLGLREDGRLLAMAGERFRVPGFTEISMICTDPSAQRRGLGARLTRAVAAMIEARGERPFLHVMVGNDGARALYDTLGFSPVRTLTARVISPL